jgi:hypothetical protein
MVGIEVLTMVASMAKRNITNITPATARLRLAVSVEVDAFEGFTLHSLRHEFRAMQIPYQLNYFLPGVKPLNRCTIRV